MEVEKVGVFEFIVPLSEKGHLTLFPRVWLNAATATGADGYEKCTLVI